MKYRQVFTNEYVQITTHTNSLRLHKLINNFFDFQQNLRSTRQIKIKSYLQVINPSKNHNDKFIYQSQSLHKKNRIFSFMDTRIIHVATDLQSNTVNVQLRDFDEPLKERILDFALMQPLYHILGHHGFFHMHASWVSKDHSSILISGPTNSGKSTLAFLLAQHGFQIRCDDDCFVKVSNGQIRIMPLPTKMGLKENMLKWHPELAKRVLRNYFYGSKQRVSLKHVTTNTMGPSVCKAIFFPKYGMKKNLCITELPKAESIKRLVGECSTCSYPEKESSKMIWTFFSFAKQTRSFELIYNDKNLCEIPDAIRRCTLS